MSDAAAMLAGLSPERRRLLELLLQREREGAAPAAHAVPRRAGAGPAPLSYTQQRLWLLHRLDPEGSAYNIAGAVRLRGRLDAAALGRTLGEVVRRHEALRTTFAVEAGGVVQRVGEARPWALPLVDLSDLPADGREAAARSRVEEQARAPFDLARGPVLRTLLLRLDADDHVMALVTHHVVSDAWSMGVLVREVAALYAAYVEGEESPLAEPPVQYADFAAWEQDWLRGPAVAEQLAYWRHQLAGSPPPLELPTDRPRPAARSARGATETFTLPADTADALRDLARSEGATLFMVLLAGFKALLYRYTGQADVSVGSPVAGRSRAETEGLIGCFINTLVMRTRLSGDATFRELVGRVRETALGAFANQDVPFQKVVEALRQENAALQPQLFNVWFVLQNAPHETLTAPGLSFSPYEVERGTSQFDLALMMGEDGARLAGALDYDTDLYDADTDAELLARFAHLLAQVAARPDLRLLDVPLGPEEAEPAPPSTRGAAEDFAAEDQFVL
jgi:hypothetical protein